MNKYIIFVFWLTSILITWQIAVKCNFQSSNMTDNEIIGVDNPIDTKKIELTSKRESKHIDSIIHRGRSDNNIESHLADTLNVERSVTDVFPGRITPSEVGFEEAIGAWQQMETMSAEEISSIINLKPVLLYH